MNKVKSIVYFKELFFFSYKGVNKIKFDKIALMDSPEACYGFQRCSKY